MIVSYNQIIGSSVLSVKEQKLCGKVAEVVLQKTDLKIKALILKKPYFLMREKAVSFSDILEFDKKIVVVNDEDSITDISELISVGEALKNRLKGRGQKTYTKSGKFIGIVYDYTIDSQSGLIYNLSVKNLLSDKLISRSSIIELKGSCFIIEDDYMLVKNVESVAETA